MAKRLGFWLGAGVVAAGVTVGILAGAGAAHAQTGSDSDAGAKTSQSADSTDNQQDSKNDDRRGVKAIKALRDAVDDAVTKVVKAAGDGQRSQAASPNVRTTQAKPQTGQRKAKLFDNIVAAVTPKPDRKDVVDKTDSLDEADPVETVETTVANRLIRNVPDTLLTPRLAAPLPAAPSQSDIALATPMLAQPQATAAVAKQIDVPPVISAIGTAVFGLISFGESVIEGPPKVPPALKDDVSVNRSTLQIGDQEVPADWYVPTGETPPEHIIYLQHGFLARGVFYDYTAAYLAKETNSIVVAPTLTSNIFATDGMWLGGDQMHRAVADLFVDDNNALYESAQAAGYTGDEAAFQQLPVVLVGHSLGGGLVIDVARYLAEDEANGKPTRELAGVLMLDGVSFTDPVPILQGIPDDIPVYNLSSTPNPWNLFGTMDHALAEVRGDQFHGAQLFGSWHSDAMVGGNPLVQFGAYLLTGYGGPANVEGSQILAASWINDMFAGDQTPDFSAPPGSSFVISTPFGPAIGLVQPKPGPITSALREVTAVFFGLLGHINFATDAPTQDASCPAGPAASSPSCSAALAA